MGGLTKIINKKNILIVSHFCGDFNGKTNNRFNYIADLLAQNEHNVNLVTTDFSHSQKRRKDKTENQKNIKVIMCHEPGYVKNVSLKRFYSHRIMGRNLKKYFVSSNKPDVIYCAVPSLDAARVAAEYAQDNEIRFIIDIQDLWPEAFRMVFNVPLISDILFKPFLRQADYIYKTADEIIAVSQTYIDRALHVNNKTDKGYSVFLGTELAYFDRLAKRNKINDKRRGEIWLAYIGTLGYSYDLICVMDAINILRAQKIEDIKFIIMGDGPLKQKFENYAKNTNIQVEFTGKLDYGKMVGMLATCDIAVNPIKNNSAASIINKHADYAAAGLPVLNTQECPEYRELLEKYNAGINCNNSDAQDLADNLLKLYKNEKLRYIMGENSRKMAEEKFDRAITYKEILDVILK